MSNNIGKNLKVLAITLFIIITVGGAIALIIIGVVGPGNIRDTGHIAIGLAILGGGTFLQLIISFLMYGLGRLIENSERISSQLDDISKQLSSVKANSSTPRNTVQTVNPDTDNPLDDDSLPTL